MFLMSSISPLATIAAAMIPITFWASLPPCPTLNAADESNCNFLNISPTRYAVGVVNFSTYQKAKTNKKATAMMPQTITELSALDKLLDNLEVRAGSEPGKSKDTWAAKPSAPTSS